MKRNFTKEIAETLKELSRDYDHKPLGFHITHAIDGSQLEWMDDEQLSNSLTTYLEQLNLDIQTQIIGFDTDFLPDEEDEY